MGDVVPFRKKPAQSERGYDQDEELLDPHDRGGTMLHHVFDRLAELEGFAVGLPKDRLIFAAHHAVDLQDEVHLLAGFRDDRASEESQRLAEMAAQLEIVPLADYICGLSALDAHRTPQRVMVYTASYIDRIPRF